MSLMGGAPRTHRPSRGFIARNILPLLGFKARRESHTMFPTLPRDYIRRRRAIGRITNIVLVLLLSAAVAYVIVHASAGSPGFSLPRH